MDRKSLMNNYWKYYIALENDLIRSFEYVELADNNLGTYSIYYARLIQSIGSELDGFFKEYCGVADKDKANINVYYSKIMGSGGKYTGIVSQRIGVDGYGKDITPFDEWNLDNTKHRLTWWDAYNGIKHNRIDNMCKANLQNTLNILGALFLLEMKMLSEITAKTDECDIPNTESKLFTLREWNFRYMSHLSIGGKISNR
jgi:hypothetical protein